MDLPILGFPPVCLMLPHMRVELREAPVHAHPARRLALRGSTHAVATFLGTSTATTCLQLGTGHEQHARGSHSPSRSSARDGGIPAAPEPTATMQDGATRSRLGSTSYPGMSIS